MGFFPFMKGRLERKYEKGRRFILAEVFDSILNKWTGQEFEGYDPEKPLAWIAEHMKMVEM